MAEKLGPAFAVSRIGAATKYGGTTYTLKAHFHTRDHAETARRLLKEQPLPPGPYPEQAAAQAELIDLPKLEQAMAWMGLSAPSGEMLGWWVGREVNRLLDAVLAQCADIRLSRAAESSVATGKAAASVATEGGDKLEGLLREHHEAVRQWTLWKSGNGPLAPLVGRADAAKQAIHDMLAAAPEASAQLRGEAPAVPAATEGGVPDHIARDVEQCESADRWNDGVSFKSRWERKLYEGGFSAGWDRARLVERERTALAAAPAVSEQLRDTAVPAAGGGEAERKRFEATLGAALKADQSEFALSRAHQPDAPYTFLATRWAWQAWCAALASLPAEVQGDGAERRVEQHIAAARGEPLYHVTKDNGDCVHWCKACAAEWKEGAARLGSAGAEPVGGA